MTLDNVLVTCSVSVIVHMPNSIATRACIFRMQVLTFIVYLRIMSRVRPDLPGVLGSVNTIRGAVVILTRALSSASQMLSWLKSAMLEDEGDKERKRKHEVRRNE